MRDGETEKYREQRCVPIGLKKKAETQGDSWTKK